MSYPEQRQSYTQDEYWEVTDAASRVSSYACSLSAEYIQDGMLRLEFNNEVACYMDQIVQEFESGLKSFTETIAEILEEHSALIEHTLEYASLVIGLIAGGYQVVGGIVMCGSGWTCPIGILTIAHGVNNIYENGNTLLTGRRNSVGPVRYLYRNLAELPGNGKVSNGDIAYGLIDLSLSGYGLLRSVPKKDARRLFRYMDEDLITSYKETKALPLSADILADSITIKNLLDTSDNKEETQGK